jgi:hypothetical protein
VITFDDFGWEALSREAKLQGTSVEELVYHAAIYYLATPDTGRVSYGVPRETGERPAESEEADE